MYCRTGATIACDSDVKLAVSTNLGLGMYRVSDTSNSFGAPCSTTIIRSSLRKSGRRKPAVQPSFAPLCKYYIAISELHNI